MVVPLPASTAHRVLLAAETAEIEGDTVTLAADAVAIVANKN